MAAMHEKMNWIKQNFRIIASLAIVILGGIGLILSSNLMHSHNDIAYLQNSLGSVNEPASGDNVKINVYAVDPNSADLKGRLLYSEISETQQQLNFSAPEGVNPPYLLEFQSLSDTGYVQKAGYVN